MDKIMHIFPQHIKNSLKYALMEIHEPIEEIRIARGHPVIIRTADKEYFLKDDAGETICAGKEDIENILYVACEHSMYLKEDEINRGFLTLKGGFRIGVCGTVSYINGQIVHHGDVTSLNIRLQREIIGCGTKVADALFSNGYIQSSLIVSPPKRGKTTILRDIARILSDERRLRVGIVDERKELWGTGDFNLGIRSDVLCGCSKYDGIMMLLRTMAPEVIIADELGSKDDLKAVEYAGSCGVSVIASIHGRDMEDVSKKGIGGNFERFVILGEKYGEFKIYKGVNGT